MRAIGQCELALELMCERALTRKAFGKRLSDFANVREWIAHSRVEIEQARLLALHAAWLMDKRATRPRGSTCLPSSWWRQHTDARARPGDPGVRRDGPDARHAAVGPMDRGRALHIVDGPDEVHLRVIARDELRRAKANLGATAAYYLNPDNA